jgi:hypothetical protein
MFGAICQNICLVQFVKIFVWCNLSKYLLGAICHQTKQSKARNVKSIVNMYVMSVKINPMQKPENDSHN